MSKVTTKDLDELYDSIPGAKPISSHDVLGEVRAIAERAINNSNGFHENWMELYEALDLIKDKVSEHFSTDGVCFICKTPTENISSDPMKWRIDLPFYNGNGLLRQYHQGCVVALIEQGNGI